MIGLTPEKPGLSIFSQFNELRNAWQQDYPKRSEGPLLALSGFEHQFLLTLLKIVRLWKASTETDRQDCRRAETILAEAISDITELGINVTVTQVKRTLSDTGLKKALEELWKIFNLASKKTPDLVKHLRFLISGKFDDCQNPEGVIQRWRTRSKGYPGSKLKLFKKLVRYELVPDPRSDLSTELQILGLDEDAETIISRWLGYLLQLGSGSSPESISTLIWKELIHDRSLEAFRATLARLFSRSQSRLGAIRNTLGDRITLPRAKLLELQASVLDRKITLLLGRSGSGKSALCKIGIQQYFKQNFDCIFLQASDVASFTESPDVTANRGIRRLDELLVAQITQKPVLVIIDDLSDVDDRNLDAVLHLLQNTLTAGTPANVQFILVAHTDAKKRIDKKIAERFSNRLVCAKVELPQLPIEELESSEDLPSSIVSLSRRHREFGPALNLKLIDYLVRSVEKDKIDVSLFRNDLDLLDWFWESVQKEKASSDEGRTLIKIAKELANKFTPDIPCYFNSSIQTETLHILVRRDCIRIVDERLAVTHRFVGDCARFYDLWGNRREIESEHLVEWLKNPLWGQPIRWFTLKLASENSETWQELLSEALEGKHLLLLDVLLDGAILSKQPGFVLQECPDESLSFTIDRLITRLFAIATEPYPFQEEGSQSTPLQTHIATQEQITGISKPELWEPVWRWLLSQSPEIVIDKSCRVFKAAEAWLNWSDLAEKFPLRSEVAEFILDLAQTVLLPDPDPQTQIINASDFAKLAELIELRQQGVIPKPEPIGRKYYYLGEFQSNAFACIVFALRIIPERSTWLLRALAGREIIPANKLEPTEISPFLTRPGVGVLEPPHPQGPLGKVNGRFRKFMLKWNGLYLNAVVLVDPQLGVELFLALIIQPPRYLYEEENDDDGDFGTEGSDDIDVCTFKFLPLLSLLEINEEVAINLVNTLCQIVTRRKYEVDESLENDRVIDVLKTDTHELRLIIDNLAKVFQGERKALYWHRNCYLAPQILNCLLMTLEGWLYSRPTRVQLERSISIILNRSDTVAMLGILVTLAKCDFSLLSRALLPLVSSLQLLIWLEFEQIERDEYLGLGTIGTGQISPEDKQELLEFNQLSYRQLDLQKIILALWVNAVIPLEVQSTILRSWDSCQLDLVPEISRSRALRIRAWFEHGNGQEQIDSEGQKVFQFIGTIPIDSQKEAEAEACLWDLHHLQLALTCREILDREQEKTLELHNYLVELLTSDRQVNDLKEKLESQAFRNVVWAAIAIILSPPVYTLNEDAETKLKSIAESLSRLPIYLDGFQRCQHDPSDASSFIANIAPKLIGYLQSDNSIARAAFRCLIGGRNCHTSAFMRSWIEEYGFEHPLTQQLIDVAPRIARLLALTYKFAYIKHVQKVIRPDGSYIVPRSEEIDYEIRKRDDPIIEEAWLSLQNNFVENKLQVAAIIDAFEWIPEVLIQPVQQTPEWLQNRFIDHSFDWEFLTAALIPVLTAKVEDDDFQKIFHSLEYRVIFAILYERASVYAKHKDEREEYKINDLNQLIDEYQIKLLDAVFSRNDRITLERIDRVFEIFSHLNLIDFVVLENIIETLSYHLIDDRETNINNNLLRNKIASKVGNYLVEFMNLPDNTLQTIGTIFNVWEKLIELLSRNSKKSENIIHIDRDITKFFKDFQNILFFNEGLRLKLYNVEQMLGYKQFRQIIFTTLIQNIEISPNTRNDESKSLVQMLAKLWDGDRAWIFEKLTRCQGLRTLLGQLQEINAIGAINLADRVARFLANSSD